MKILQAKSSQMASNSNENYINNISVNSGNALIFNLNINITTLCPGKKVNHR